MCSSLRSRLLLAFTEWEVKQCEKRERFGRKNGKGFYDYPQDGAKRLWPGLADLQKKKLDPEGVAHQRDARCMTAPHRAAEARRTLDAARRLLAEVGYNTVTMDDIAKEAGVAYQTVYSVFGTKLRLAEAMIEARTMRIQKRLTRRALLGPSNNTLSRMASTSFSPSQQRLTARTILS